MVPYKRERFFRERTRAMLKNEEPVASVKNKKPYQQPTLRVYGNIASITASAGSAGTNDGGTKTGFMMTH
jgi:hypothetical protein